NTTLTPKGRFFTSLTPALVENFMARCWGKDLPSRRRFSLRGVCWSRMYQQRCPLPDEILDLVLQVMAFLHVMVVFLVKMTISPLVDPSGFVLIGLGA
ncbi:hypothetical protein BHM03_00041631, partial [Ensete ventricosum]